MADVTQSFEEVSAIATCRAYYNTRPGTTQGGCGGFGRRGDKVDEHVSEAVLTKLE
jgi:hypothetical protein